MFHSSAGGRVRLNVRAADDETEITVVRGSEVVAKGRGILLHDLKPGIYVIQGRAGFEVSEKTIVLESGDGERTVPVDPVEFSCAAPLSFTKYARMEHAEAAIAQSQKIHVETGSQSWIFVFARDWGAAARSATTNPARGLALYTLDGTLIADLGTQSETNLSGDPWAACNVRLDPGSYKLVLELATGERISQVIAATLGWQTQIFLLRRSYSDDPEDRRADLMRAAILLAPLRAGGSSPVFRPDQPILRRVELARLQLLNASTAFLDAVRQQVQTTQFIDPMLGIYSAHLILRDENPDLPLVHRIVQDLRQRGFSEHPDVRALALFLDVETRSTPFSVPPMLRPSWDLVLRSTVRHPHLVPLNSLAAVVAETMWGEDPWVLWKEATAGQELEEKASRDRDLYEALEAQMLRLRAPAQHTTRDGQIEDLVISCRLPRNRIEELLTKMGANRATATGQNTPHHGTAMRTAISSEDIDALEEILARLISAEGGNPHDFLSYILDKAVWPPDWTYAFGVWPGNIRVAARKLIKWALERDINPRDTRFTALGSVIFAVLTGAAVGPADGRSLALMLVAYNFCRDASLRDQLKMRFQIAELASMTVTEAQPIGPEINWRGPGELELQSWLQPQPDLEDVAFFQQLVARAGSVCRIENSQSQWRGTGFLIGPRLLLTNYHLLERYGLPTLKDSARDAVLRFACFSASSAGDIDGQTFKLDQSEPIVKSSPTDELDYVLLRAEDRLDRVAGIGPAPYDVRPPAKRDGLSILQHPEGQTMKVAISKDGVTGVYPKESRVQYVNRTLAGSSGSPCFNHQWKVVALHHAQRSRGAWSIREGILVSAIVQDIGSLLD